MSKEGFFAVLRHVRALVKGEKPDKEEILVLSRFGSLLSLVFLFSSFLFLDLGFILSCNSVLEKIFNICYCGDMQFSLENKNIIFPLDFVSVFILFLISLITTHLLFIISEILANRFNIPFIKLFAGFCVLLLILNVLVLFVFNEIKDEINSLCRSYCNYSRLLSYENKNKVLYNFSFLSNTRFSIDEAERSFNLTYTNLKTLCHAFIDKEGKK